MPEDLPVSIAQAWLSGFASALYAEDVDALVALFLPNGWFRDLLTFTWDLRTRRGREEIKEYLLANARNKEISNLQVDLSRPGLEPTKSLQPNQKYEVEVALTFETPKAWGRGFVRLQQDPDSGDSWKALSVMMMIDNWKGHEEQDFELGIYDGHNLSWQEVQAERKAKTENDPQVLIVGAGQAGLQMGARLRQLGIRTLIIEQTSRIGDVWRKRYPTLALHTPRSQHCFLYEPYPSNWPVFTPKDRLAFWFEQYAEANDLVIWSSSTLVPKPEYDPETKRWEIVIDREGKHVTVKPSHLIMAINFLGNPTVPAIPGLDTFSGEWIHASDFTGGTPYKGKRVVVVGAGNTSADICQDLVFRGASSVTMVQRSSTCVVSDKIAVSRMNVAFPDKVPSEISDFKNAGQPFGLLRGIMRASQPLAEKVDKEMHDGLRKVGFHLNNGPDGSGQLVMFFTKGGGYFIDVGAAPLIINGKIKIKHGVEVQRITPKSLIFTDGDELEADAIIFATGWNNVRDKLRPTLGDEVIDKTKDVWGTDEEDELKGVYKLSGYPGLWFACGNFAVTRVYSKQLGLFIQAIELGLTSF